MTRAARRPSMAGDAGGARRVAGNDASAARRSGAGNDASGARRHVVGNDVSTLRGFESADAPVEPAEPRDTEPTVDPREPAWKRAAADEPRSPAWRRMLARVRFPAKKAPSIDPTLPVSAQIVAVQNPSATLPERPYDLLLIAAVLALLGIGTIEIYSATAADALTHFHDSAHYLERQLMYMACGGVALWFGARIDYRKLKTWTYPLLVISLLLLGAALGMPSRNGAKRWIPMGPFTFQPVEIAKLALVTYLACSLGRKAEQIKTFSVGFVPHLVVCGMMMALLLKQPDLGSSVVLGVTTLGMLFMAGTRVSYIMFAVLGSAPIAYHLVVGTPWRMQRMLAFFNPDGFANKEAYQFIQARLAIGSGGLFGAGLGGGHQTLGFLPEAHSDFALAPIGEEMGWIGIALVLLLFGILLWRGIRAALGARDVFGGYLAFGITLMLGLQLLFNVGVVLGVVPNKGITLPLVSYGGTSLITTMFLVGLILNVGRRPDRSAAREGGSREPARKRRVRVRVAPA